MSFFGGLLIEECGLCIVNRELCIAPMLTELKVDDEQWWWLVLPIYGYTIRCDMYLPSPSPPPPPPTLIQIDSARRRRPYTQTSSDGITLKPSGVYSGLVTPKHIQTESGHRITDSHPLFSVLSLSQLSYPALIARTNSTPCWLAPIGPRAIR